MRIKTIIIILITVLLTILLMQNTGRDSLDFLWGTFYMSKLIMLAFVAVIAFVLGWLAGRPKRIKRLGGDGSDYDPKNPNPGTLSDEDKEYIK
jgi:uncharacterized integral membrane protein